MSRFLAVSLVLGAGCAPGGDPTGTLPSTTAPSGETGGATETGAPTGTTLPGDTAGHTGLGIPTTSFDCSDVPAAPVPFRKLPWAPSAEDFTFSADGYMISVPGGRLERTPFGGPPEVLVPGLGDVRGTRFLPDGRLALAHPEDGSVWVVDPATGGHTVTAGGLDTPNGVAIDPQGRIYVATHGRIVRIEPDTHVTDIVADLPGNSFDGVTFSPDYRRLYFDEETGQVHWVEFDEDMNPGAPQGPLRIPITFSPGIVLLDGMGMDACGNLYVIEMDGKVWRVRTDGTMEVVIDIGGLATIPALNFGLPDSGGWVGDRLYVLDFLGAVWEADVGVPGKWEPHMPR